jgi:hypothetical protein
VSWDGRPGAERDRDGCFSHCVAFLLGMPTMDVPNFAQTAPGPSMGEMLAEARVWCADRGYTLIAMPSHHPLEEVCNGVQTLNPGIPYILAGLSADEDPANHAIVYCDGKTLCAPGSIGIDGPCDDGNYWCVFLGAKPSLLSQAMKAVDANRLPEGLPPVAIFR